MNDTQLSKFKHCLAGMENAEKLSFPDLEHSESVRTVAKGLLECQDMESFSEFMSDKGLGTPVAAVPVGLFFWNSLPLIIDWGRADFFLDGMSGKCAGVAVGILVSNAMFETPIGVWGNEVAAVMSGIDDEFVSLIDQAVSMASETGPSEAMGRLHEQGDMMTSVIAASLHCCIVSRGSYQQAVKLANQCEFSSGAVPALAGALMGIVDPDGVGDPGEWESLALEILEARP